LAEVGKFGVTFDFFECPFLALPDGPFHIRRFVRAEGVDRLEGDECHRANLQHRHLAIRVRDRLGNQLLGLRLLRSVRNPQQRNFIEEFWMFAKGFEGLIHVCLVIDHRFQIRHHLIRR
jgi:hypothetical protein